MRNGEKMGKSDIIVLKPNLERIIKLSVFISVFLLIISFISCGGAVSEGTDPIIEAEKLEEQSILDYKIALLQSNPETNFAADQLSNYLYKATGRQIQIIEGISFEDILNSKNYIVIGSLNKTVKNKLGITAKIPPSKKEAFIIKNFNGNLCILGKSSLATIYGVYHFLEKYVGIKWLSKKYEYVPKNISKISIPVDEDLQIPRFTYREVFIGESDDPDFALRLRDNGRLGHRNLRPLKFGNVFIKGAHELVPRKKYAKKHPEYFCGGQLDYTLQAVKRIALKNADKQLSKFDNSKSYYFVIGHRDIGSYCLNDISRKRIKEGGSPSTPYIDFVSYIAKNLKEKYPNVIFLASAYQWSIKPPRNYSSLPGNMGIFFAPIGMDFSKPITASENRQFYKYLRGWTRLSRHVVIWHYITNFNNYFQPYPNIYAVAKDLKIFSRLKRIEGIFLEGAYGAVTGDLSDLKLWVFSKLLWNPNQNVYQLIKEYTDFYYGKGAPYIRQYIKLLHDSIKKYPTPLFAKTPPSVPYLNLEFFVKAEDLFEKALKSVKGNVEFENHIKKAKLSIDTLLLLNRGKLEKEAVEKGIPWFDENYLQTLLEETEKTVKRENIKGYSEGGKVEDLLNILSLNRKASEIPVEVIGMEEGTDWFDFQEYTLTNCCGTKLEEDQLASDGVAVSMPGNTPAWGIQMNLGFLPPDGKWKIYFRIRISLKNRDIGLIDKVKFAFHYGVYPLTRGHFGLITNFIDEEYHTVEVGTFERNKNASLWIAPPNNNVVEKIYVDRVFIVREY